MEKICPVCGEKVEKTDLSVSCINCGTAHHRACYQKKGCGDCHYNGISPMKDDEDKFDYRTKYQEKYTSSQPHTAQSSDYIKDSMEYQRKYTSSQPNTAQSNYNIKKNFFSDIGSKIKSYAKVFLICGIIASIIGGIALMVTAPDIDSVEFICGVATIIAGIGVSTFVAIMLYGFAEIIDDNKKILNELNEIKEQNKK